MSFIAQNATWFIPEFINNAEYPEIRHLCTTNKTFNQYCKRPDILALIDKKLDQYVDKLLNQAKSNHPNSMYYGDPTLLISNVPQREFSLVHNLYKEQTGYDDVYKLKEKNFASCFILDEFKYNHKYNETYVESAIRPILKKLLSRGLIG